MPPTILFGGQSRVLLPALQAQPLSRLTTQSRSHISQRQARTNLLPGAGARTRTADLLITNQLLYQLSYAGDHAERQVS